MYRPKTWKFGRKWVGPYEVLSRQGVNYKIRSRGGKEMVVHHDHLKQCVVPANQGVPFCAVPESMDMTVADRPPAPREVAPDPQQYTRPPRLRQNIRQPLRFGDFVTH